MTVCVCMGSIRPVKNPLFLVHAFSGKLKSLCMIYLVVDKVPLFFYDITPLENSLHFLYMNIKKLTKIIIDTAFIAYLNQLIIKFYAHSFLF